MIGRIKVIIVFVFVLQSGASPGTTRVDPLSRGIRIPRTLQDVRCLTEPQPFDFFLKNFKDRFEHFSTCLVLMLIDCL